MASAAPSPLASSPETTNGTKLRRLLVDGGTAVLRKEFDGIHCPAKLASDLQLHKSTLDELCGRGILSKGQRELLFPPDGSKPDSKKFDITLLFLLLVEICGLSPPRTGWNNKPYAKNKTLPANLVRIKLFRNKLIHTPETRINTRLFNKLWKEISGVLVALGLDRTEIDRLKVERCGEEYYLDLLFKWADREKDVKLMMKEVRKGQEKMCQTQQEQSALLQDTKQAVDTVCQTQQEQNVLAQDTKQAVDTVSQTQQEQNVVLLDTKQAADTVCQTQQQQSVVLLDTKQAVESVSQTQQEQNVVLQDTKQAVDTVRQTQQEQSVLLQDTKQAVDTVCQTQQEQNVLVQDTKQAVDTVSQTQQRQSVLLQDTKQAVETVSHTQQEQNVVLQDTKQAVDTVCQTQQQQSVLLQNTKQAVETVSQTQQEQNVVLQDTKQAVDTVSQTLQEIKQTASSLVEKKNEDMEKEILQNLAKAEFKGDIEYHVGRFQEGTREWVFNKVQNWLDDRNSPNRVMVISANAGMGKSVISAVICKKMQEAGRLSGSHFCQHNNARYRNPQLMLQSLACHLCQALPEYKQALVNKLSRNLGKDLNNMGVEELFALLFNEPLSTVADPGRNMLMVIDGLDESEYQERNELLDVIANHFCKLPCWIRFLCTTRTERNIAEKLKQLKPFQLEPNDDENLQDIKLFLGNRTEYLMKPENEVAILEKLVEKSEGLMLHAYFLVSYIEENPSILDQGYLDGSLPLAISSVYRSYFKRLEKELMKELGVQEENFLNLLSAVTASREPLPIGFVSKVLVPDANSPVAKRKVLKAIGSVSSLLPVREGRLHVIHKSVKDWLTDTSSYEQHSFTVEEKDGHHILSTFCSKELDHVKQKSVCSEQFDDAAKYALMHGVQHMLESEATGSLKLEEIAKKYVTDLEIVYAKLSVNNTAASEDLFCVQKQESFKYLCSEARGKVRTLLFLLRKNSGVLREHPRFILQTVLNEGVPVLSSEARSLLQSKYPEIPFMEYIHKGDHQPVVLARFECFSKVLCFDVSQRLDYMVCECQDGTIQLWSINTGNREWKRPVLEKKKCRHAYREFPLRVENDDDFFTANLYSPKSFYRSVVFHPNGKLVLPGSLCEVYSIAGDRKQLFSKSDCKFSVCTFFKGNTRMLTDCPTNSKCVVMWNLRTGEEITRIVREEDILCFQCSPDGTRLAISHVTGQICLVDLVNELTELGEISTSEACGFMNFFPDNQALACLHLSRLSKCRFRLNIAPGNPFQVVDHIYNKVSPWEFEIGVENAFLVGDTMDNSSKQLSRVVPYWEVGFLIQLSDESALMSSPDLGYLSLINRDKLKEVSQESPAVVTDIRFSTDGATVYVVCGKWQYQATVTAWDCSSWECKAEKHMWLTSLAPVKEGVVVLTTSQDGQGNTPELWDVELLECKRRWTDLKGTEKVLSISEENVAFVGDGNIHVLSTTNDLLKKIGYDNKEGINNEDIQAVNTKNQLITIGSRYEYVCDDLVWICRLCNAASPWEIKWGVVDEEYPPPKCMFSPKEEFCVMWDSYRVNVLDADTGEQRHALFKKGEVVDCNFISHSGFIVCFQEYHGNVLRMFDVRSGELLSLIEIEGKPFCLGTCLHSLHVAVGLSGSEFKLLQVYLPQVEDDRNIEREVHPLEVPWK